MTPGVRAVMPAAWAALATVMSETPSSAAMAENERRLARYCSASQPGSIR